MSNPDITPGFNRPRVPKDERTKKLYEKHELGPQPSLADLEPKATKLLSDPLTMIEGAELVLGRSVASDPKKEPFLTTVLFSRDGPERFGVLLLQTAIEEMDREKKFGEK